MKILSLKQFIAEQKAIGIDLPKYYDNGNQYITLSGHGDERLEYDKRLWWSNKNHLTDHKFIDFANKCLERLKNPPKTDDKGIRFPNYVRGEVGFCDLNEKKGFVTSLRESRDGTLSSFHIVTVLNMEVMNPKLPLFVKQDTTYIINVDKEPKQETIKNKITELNKEIKNIQDKRDDIYLELEYAEKEEDKVNYGKQLKKIDAQLEILKNTIKKLEKDI